jgi:hypothetical protein
MYRFVFVGSLKSFNRLEKDSCVVRVMEIVNVPLQKNIDNQLDLRQQYKQRQLLQLQISQTQTWRQIINI